MNTVSEKCLTNSRINTMIDDTSIISAQIQREKIHPYSVVKRCSSGYPVVIKLDPVAGSSTLNEGDTQSTVFTTLYWLTCPMLTRRMYDYESTGMIKDLESEAYEDKEFAEALGSLHSFYAKNRIAALGQTRLDSLHENRPAIARALEETGVGGTRDFAHVKCLHAHAAYHLVHENHPLFLRHEELSCNTDGCNECKDLAV